MTGFARRPARVALIACFAAQLVVAFVVIPPWQNPDEPQHLMTVRLLRMYGPDFILERDLDRASEQAIVESMARYGWWGHYGRSTPVPPPRTFADGPALVVGDYFGALGGGSRLYYRAIARLFDIVSIEDVLAQMYAMRAVSALAAAFTIALVWAGSRRLLDERAALVITALVALHPQFVLVSATASPDALVNLAGGVIWRQAGILLTSEVAVIDLLMLWGAALGAFAVRRMGAPLLVMAGLVSAVLLWRAVREGHRRTVLTFAGVAVSALAIVAAVGISADLGRAVNWIRFDPGQSVSTIAARSGQFPAFVDMFFTTFWLSAGWLRYPGPEWWQFSTFVISILAAAGLLLLVFRRTSTAALWLSGTAVAAQALAVVAYYFGILQTGPQGRYLFPVLPAIFCLVWLGWNAIAASRLSPQRAAASLVIVMAFLNVSAWVFVVLPAYL